MIAKIILDELPPGVRQMTMDDLPGVLAIERDAYEFPWTEGIFQDCLRVGYLGWVYEDAEGLAGYGFMSVAAGEGHILNLCVHPERQQQGVGSDLLKAMLLSAKMLETTVLFLEVRVSNQAAIQLYLKYGFNEVGIRSQYYPSIAGREDAMVLAKEL